MTTQGLSPAGSPAGTPSMATQSSFQSRRSRPSHVLTHLLPNSSQHMSIPESAISAHSMISTSSAASVSSSLHGSPALIPEGTPGLTAGNSIQASPEPLRGRGDTELFPPPAFQLPESVLPPSVYDLSHKSSTGSLVQTLIHSSNATPNPNSAGFEGLNVNNNNINNNNNSKGLLRRLSNKASSTIRGAARRQSSAHGSGRGASVGPSLARPRQRSNSDLTNPFTDSDDEPMAEVDDKISLLSLGLAYGSFGGPDMAAGRDPSPTSAPSPLNGGSGAQCVVAGPVVPLELRQGTRVFKISKRGNRKPLTLVLDSDSTKILWDMNRTSKCIYIDDIKEIRNAEDIRQYCLDYGVPEHEQPLFFSILYTVPEKSRNKMMHLIAPDRATANSWVTTLYAISMHRQDMMSSLMSFNDKAIQTYWKNELVKQLSPEEDSDSGETIDFPGVERVCRSLHIHVSSDTLKSKFHEADATGTGRLNFNEFQEFVRLMKRREDIKTIYREVASDLASGITLEDFLVFLSESQGENVEGERTHWESVFAHFARRGNKSKDATGAAAVAKEEDDVLRMSEAGLASFLTSTYNIPIVSAPKDFTLDRPVNEYFISSSHNTYLLGRQVVGSSSVEGYISALVRGCRCVEVDCWDGADGQPMVSHGWTLTTAISFREVITVINKYAFKATDFPLWVSLEVHCNPDQQRKMAVIMREVFGARLVTEPLDPSSDKLPSPSELKGRILVKAKKPGIGGGLGSGGLSGGLGIDIEYRDRREGKDDSSIVIMPGGGRRRGNSLTSPYSKPMLLDNATVPALPLPHSLPHSPLLTPSTGRRTTKTRVRTITEGRVHLDTTSGSPSDCDSGSEKEPGGHQSKIVKELGDLAVYCAGIKFQGFEHSECKTYNHVLSFHEGTFEKNSRPGDTKRALYRHNMRHLMRVYPHRGRLYSSNFDPLIVWRRGVQMAALNWQTFDLGMQLNQAMFDGGTDQSGYVLKPVEFREIQHFPYLPEHMINGKRARKHVSFTIDVISAQQLMRPHHFRERQTVDPYIEVEAFLADDKRNKRGGGNTTSTTDFSSGPSIAKHKTRVMRENGFNPVFDERFTFNLDTKYPDLVFVRFQVRLSDGGNSQSDRNTVLASFTAKLSSLKQGIRTLPLLDGNGDRYLFSTLCCRVRVDPVTDIMLGPGDAGYDYHYYYDEDNRSGREDGGPGLSPSTGGSSGSPALQQQQQPSSGGGGKLRGIGRTVFNRGGNISPKSSVDSGSGGPVGQPERPARP